MCVASQLQRKHANQCIPTRTRVRARQQLREDMQPVIYDQEMLDQLDGILSCAAQVLTKAKKAMAALEQHGTDVPVDDVETLLAMRDEMAMRLARYDQGLWIPDSAADAAFEMEDEASEILCTLGLDSPDYQSPELREVYRQALASVIADSDPPESGTQKSA